MIISVNAVELLWLALSVVATTVTVAALLDARADVRAVRELNGAVRGIVVRGTFRRECVRLGIQAALFALVFPSLFTDREATLTPGLPIIFAIPVLMLVNTALDQRDRVRISKKIAKDVDVLRSLQMDRLETDLAENTRITQEASDNATAAFEAANHINEKIASQGAKLVEQGERAVADHEVGRDTNATAHRIDERTP